MALVDGFVRAQMFDARTQQVARPPNDAVHGVTFRQQQFGEIGTILTGDAGDEGTLRLGHGG